MNRLIDLETFIDGHYGARSTAVREAFEEGYAAFRQAAMRQGMCEENNPIRKQQVARRDTTNGCGSLSTSSTD